MENVKMVCGKTKTLTGKDGRYFQLNYHVFENAVFIDEFIDPAHKTSKSYHDRNVLECGNIYEPVKMKEIEQMVNTELSKRSIDTSKIKRRS